MLQTRHEYNTSFFEQEDLNVINLKITEFSKVTKLIYNIYRYNELAFSTEHKPISENVSIPFDELPLGDYRHELIMVFQGKKHIIFLGKLLIIEKNIEKFYCDGNPNIVIDTENNIFNIEIKASGAQGVPGNNGWTPVYYDEVYEGKIIRKLADYISGSGTKPTGNIGLYISASGYTSDKKLALNYKGEKGEGADIVISSVNPNQTSTQLNALADGLYFANGSGLYKFSPAVVMGTIDGVAVANNTVPEGYIVTFSKKGTTWSLNSAIKLPSYSLPTMSSNTKGGAKSGKSLKVTNEVLDVNIDGDTIYQDPDGKLKSKQSSDGSVTNVATYIHSGNKEVVVSSINYSTNTLTSNAHGLANGDRVAFNKTIDCNILTQTPFSNGWNVDSSGGGWFVVNSTTNTFQLSLTNNGTPIVLTERATNDFSKWKIEVQPTVNSIAVNNLNATSLEIEIVGPTFRNTRYLLNNQSIYNGYRVRDNNNSSDTGISVTLLSDNYNIFTNHSIKVNVSNGVEFIESICNSTKLVDSKIILTKDVACIQPIRNTPITNIPSLSLSNLKPMNGTEIIIEKLA